MKLSEGQKSTFLASLRLGNSVAKACADASIPRRTVYYFRAEDESFADAWEEAKTASLEDLEDHLRKRATDPSDRQSHILLMFLLKRLQPAYKDSWKEPEKKSIRKIQEFEFSAEEVDAALTILDAAKAKAKRD